MARISLSPLIEELIGKLAGSVFQDSYGGLQVRTRVSPRNPQTQYQQLRRGEFGYLSGSWRNLTSIQRQTFIDAASTPPAALNLFLQSNINLTLIEEPTITTYIPSSDPGTMDISFIDATPTSMNVVATGATTVVPAGTKLLVQVTFLKAPTRIFTNPSMFSPVISFDEGTDLAIPTDILSAWQSRYGVLIPDKRVCLKSCLIDKSNGLRGADSINCTITEEMAKFVRIFTDITPANSVGTGVTDIFSHSIPANTFLQDGDTVISYINGVNAVLGAPAQINFEIGGVPAGGISAVSNTSWIFIVTLMRVSSSDLRYNVYGLANASFALSVNNLIAAVDFTSAIATNWTIQSPSSGTVTGLMSYMNKQLI